MVAKRGKTIEVERTRAAEVLLIRTIRTRVGKQSAGTLTTRCRYDLARTMGLISNQGVRPLGDGHRDLDRRFAL